MNKINYKDLKFDKNGLGLFSLEQLANQGHIECITRVYDGKYSTLETEKIYLEYAVNLYSRYMDKKENENSYYDAVIRKCRKWVNDIKTKYNLSEIEHYPLMIINTDLLKTDSSVSNRDIMKMFNMSLTELYRILMFAYSIGAPKHCIFAFIGRNKDANKKYKWMYEEMMKRCEKVEKIPFTTKIGNIEAYGNFKGIICLPH